MKNDPGTAAACCRFPSNSLLLDELVDQSMDESFQRSHTRPAAGLPDTKAAAGCRSPKRNGPRQTMTNFKLSSPLCTALLLVVSVLFGTSLQAQQTAAGISKMPDISGTWLMGKGGENGRAEIRRVADDSAEFVIRISQGKGKSEQTVKWSPETQRFEATVVDETTQRSAKTTLQLLADGKSMRFAVEVDEQAKREIRQKAELSEEQLDELLNQVWTRVKGSDGKVAIAAKTPTAPATPPTDKPVADSKMPDISGRWFVYQRGHVVKNKGAVKHPLKHALQSIDDVLELVIQRSADGTADFVEKVADGESSSWRIKWSEPTQRFQWKWADDPINQYDFTMMVLPDGKTTRVRITQSKKDGSTDGKRSEAEVEAVYYEEWSREKNLYAFGFNSQNPRLESQEILVNESFDGLAFFSKPHGKWIHLRIPRPEFSLLLSQTNVAQEFAVTKTDDAVYGFSSRTGRFAKLPIPKELRDPHKNWPLFNGNSATVELGNEIYVITAQSGEWSSPNSPAPTNSPDPSNDLTTADSKMPDIVGTWRVRIVSPDIGTGTLVEMEIRRVPSGFLIDNPWTEDAKRVTVRWLEGLGRFEGSWEADGDRHKITLQPLVDGDTLRVVVANRLNQSAKEASEKNNTDDKPVWDLTTQDWTRISKSLSTTFPEKRYGITETLMPAESKPDVIQKVHEPTERLAVLMGQMKALTTREVISRISIAGTDIIDFKQLSETQIAVIGKGVGSASLLLWLDKNSEPRTIRVTVTRETSTVRLDTPAAKQLVEQLGTQESSAAAEAAAIRQLQANGQAEQNRPAIAEHQRKLQNLLSTAFDLKLHLEELQVQELQSRLSRLERQIGQRKELREKIINRRAGELIEGDVLRWTSSDTAASKAASTPKAEATASTKAEFIDPTPQPASLPTPEELKAKLKPIADPIKAAMQRVRDLESTFFKDRSNLKELQHAMQELSQARSAWKPHVKEIEAAFDELNTEYELAELTAKALESRVAVMVEKLTQGEATEAEVRAAMTAHRNSPRTMANLEARIEKYAAAFADFGEMTLEEDEALPAASKRTGPQPSYQRAFALAWLETALQTKVEFVSLAGLDLPFKAALRIKESNNDLNAGDLVVTFIGESFETLDQAVASSNVAKKRSSSDITACLVLKGGLSGPRVTEHLDLGSNEDCLNPTAPTSEWHSFSVQVRRGEEIVGERIQGTCVGPDGLVVIPIAASSLASNKPIETYGGRDWPIQIVGTDEPRGLTLLKLSGPLRQWVKCRTALPKVDEKLRFFVGEGHSNCVVTSIGLAYSDPLKGDDAFHIKHSYNADSLHLGDKILTEDNELQGLIAGPLNDPAAKKNASQTAIVIPAVHIQKLIDEYRDKSLN